MSRPVLFSDADLAARSVPLQPFVIGEDLEQLIELANLAMRNDVEGVTLHMHSPHDLDAVDGDRDPLTPGVRRLTLTIKNPSGFGGNDPAEVSLVFCLLAAGKGPNLQLDAERVLQWLARVERANFAAVAAADDIADPAVLRTLVRDRLAAEDMANGLAAGGSEGNRVADEARAAVADRSAWSPIRPGDIVTAWCSVRRLRRTAE
jgi:hypothetical protein